MTDAQVSRASADLLPSEHIQDDIVRIALDKVEGIPSEQFANAFYGSLVGASFVPLNFLTLAPSARTARKALATVFPSILGVRLARPG